MSTFSKLLVFSCAIAFCIGAFAVQASGTTATGHIKNVYVNNGWTMVHAPDITDNPDSCNSTSYYAIKPNEPNYNAMHGTLLAAFMANKKVRFWVSGCGGQNNGFPKIVSVWVYE